MIEQKYFCPNCSAELVKVAMKNPLWLKVYECVRENRQYLKIMDMRNDYGLIETHPDFSEQLNSLTEKEASEAWLKIQFIDHKTVSVVKFEECVYLTKKSRDTLK